MGNGCIIIDGKGRKNMPQKPKNQQNLDGKITPIRNESGPAQNKNLYFVSPQSSDTNPDSAVMYNK